MKVYHVTQNEYKLGESLVVPKRNINELKGKKAIHEKRFEELRPANINVSRLSVLFVSYDEKDAIYWARRFDSQYYLLELDVDENSVIWANIGPYNEWDTCDKHKPIETIIKDYWDSVIDSSQMAKNYKKDNSALYEGLCSGNATITNIKIMQPNNKR